MQTIPYPDLAELPEAVQRQVAALPLNIVHILALASPEVFAAQCGLGGALSQPEPLDPALREAVVLRVAHVSGSAYELQQHLPLARKAGLTEMQIAAIERADYSALDPVLAATCRFADEVIRTVEPSADALAAVRAVLPDQAVMNVVLLIGFFMTLARVMAVTGIPLEDNSA
ncbi:MAG: hypothetical protein RLZZ08_828 [Pseudomonadota bacterium]|jgi:AhpD family alkylhydroperoxidase